MLKLPTEHFFKKNPTNYRGSLGKRDATAAQDCDPAPSGKRDQPSVAHLLEKACHRMRTMPPFLHLVAFLPLFFERMAQVLCRKSAKKE